MVLICSRGLTRWMCSAILINSLISWNSGERETHLLDTCSAISSVIWSNIERLTSWICVQPFSSVVLTCPDTSREKLTSWIACSAILISGFDLLKHQKVTYNLDMCSAILVSSSELIKQLRATHNLDACSAILINVILICSNSVENSQAGHIQPLLSVF